MAEKQSYEIFADGPDKPRIRTAAQLKTFLEDEIKAWDWVSTPNSQPFVRGVATTIQGHMNNLANIIAEIPSHPVDEISMKVNRIVGHSKGNSGGISSHTENMMPLFPSLGKIRGAM